MGVVEFITDKFAHGVISKLHVLYSVMNFRVIILILLLIFALGEARRLIRGGTAGAGRRSGAGLEVVGRGIASFAKSMTDDEEMEE